MEAWRALPGQRSSLHDRWHNGGPVNRSDMKGLQAEFAAHMAVLDNAAGNARKLEKQRKSLLIAEVEAALIAGLQEALKEAEAAPPGARRPRGAAPPRGRAPARARRLRAPAATIAAEAARRDGDSRPGRPRPDAAPPALLKAMRVAQEAQKRWQEERHPMPLPRKEEQALWEAFRAKCSAIFALRDAKREEEKGKIAAQESVREQIINNILALAEAADFAAGSAHLSQFTGEWNALERSDGPSRKRYDDAVARARNRLDAIKREAAAAVAGKLLAFDTELSKIEQAQAEGAAIDTAPLAAQQEELGKALSRHKGLKTRAERLLKGQLAGPAADWSKLAGAGNHRRAPTCCSTSNSPWAWTPRPNSHKPAAPASSSASPSR